MAELTPEAIATAALASLEGELKELFAGAEEESKARIAVLAQDMALYWRLRLAGKEEEAATNLKWMRAEARAVAARYAVRSGAAANRSIGKIIDTLARIGSLLLAGLIK